jgi:hypothetical protein
MASTLFAPPVNRKPAVVRVCQTPYMARLSSCGRQTRQRHALQAHKEMRRTRSSEKKKKKQILKDKTETGGEAGE